MKIAWIRVGAAELEVVNLCAKGAKGDAEFFGLTLEACG